MHIVIGSTRTTLVLLPSRSPNEVISSESTGLSASLVIGIAFLRRCVVRGLWRNSWRRKDKKESCRYEASLSFPREASKSSTTRRGTPRRKEINDKNMGKVKGWRKSMEVQGHCGGNATSASYMGSSTAVTFHLHDNRRYIFGARDLGTVRRVGRIICS